MDANIGPVVASIAFETGDSDGGTEIEDPVDNNYDRGLPTAHSYLGNDLEVLRGRTLLDDGICINLPILFEKSMILFPEQTLPMVEYSPQIIKMFRSCIDKDRTFGVVHWGKKNHVQIGTTAEIYEYLDGGSDGFRIKARGRQRFKIIKVRRTDAGQILANVKILPEIDLGLPLFSERLASLDRLRTIPKTEKEAREQEYRVSRRDSAVTPWPSWVYRQYDARRLSMKIHKNLRFFESRGSIIPEEPVELSFWLAQNLYMKDTVKIALLQHNCAIWRLQCEAKIVSSLGRKFLTCKKCGCRISKLSRVVPMTKQGLQEAYCNPAGAIHETITVCRAINVVLNREPPSTACSWFPGYAWTIANCQRCRSHLGWLFTAVNEDLKPRGFWGLTRKSLRLTRPNSPIEYTDEDNGRDDLSSDSDDDDDDENDDTERSLNFQMDMI